MSAKRLGRHAAASGLAAVVVLLTWVSITRGWAFVFTDDIGNFDPRSVLGFIAKLGLVGLAIGLLGGAPLAWIRARAANSAGARCAAAAWIGVAVAFLLSLVEVSEPQYLLDLGIGLAGSILAMAFADLFDGRAGETPPCAS